MQLFPGRPHPLGVHYDGMGANVAVYGGQADAVELCLFEEGSETRLELPEMHAKFTDHWIRVRPRASRPCRSTNGASSPDTMTSGCQQCVTGMSASKTSERVA